MGWNLWTVTRFDGEREWMVCFGCLNENIAINDLMLANSKAAVREGMQELERDFFVGECSWEGAQVIKVVTQRDQFDADALALRMWVLEDLFLKNQPARKTATRIGAVFVEFTWDQDEVSEFWVGFQESCQLKARDYLLGTVISDSEYEAFLRELLEGIRLVGSQLKEADLETVANEVRRIYRLNSKELESFFYDTGDEPRYHALKGAGVVFGSFVADYQRFREVHPPTLEWLLVDREKRMGLKATLARSTDADWFRLTFEREEPDGPWTVVYLTPEAPDLRFGFYRQELNVHPTWGGLKVSETGCSYGMVKGAGFPVIKVAARPPLFHQKETQDWIANLRWQDFSGGPSWRRAFQGPPFEDDAKTDLWERFEQRCFQAVHDCTSVRYFPDGMDDSYLGGVEDIVTSLREELSTKPLDEVLEQTKRRFRAEDDRLGRYYENSKGAGGRAIDDTGYYVTKGRTDAFDTFLDAGK